eukprot:scaffold2292_cov301-Pavlova_lutheri.AAC.2
MRAAGHSGRHPTPSRGDDEGHPRRNGDHQGDVPAESQNMHVNSQRVEQDAWTINHAPQGLIARNGQNHRLGQSSHGIRWADVMRVAARNPAPPHRANNEGS